MALKLYNSLTQSVEPLQLIDSKMVRMYTCGPTVYHFVHIGNFRTFIFQDTLRRYILYKGYRLRHVMNITDVEDKIIANAQAAGQDIGEYSKKYLTAFLQDMETLRIERPDQMPRATEHIEAMVELIQRLEAKGLTYRSNGSVYFRISAFPGYGKLSGLELESTAAQGRIDVDEYSKENPRDFVLWKARKEEEEASWDCGLGEGRPGWHIECSAMSMQYLGESFDIHCGGVDLIFPHHENEIAQSEAATGKPFVRHWVHAAHLIVEGQKMSKSKGNFFTLRDLLEKGCSPLAVRYLLQSVHYRKQLNFTLEGVEQARAAIQRIDDFLHKVRSLPDGLEANPSLSDKTSRARRGFESSMDDDLNVSEALGALFELIRSFNIELDRQEVGSANRDEILQLFGDANQIFDAFQMEEAELQDTRIRELIEERVQARLQRCFQRADQIRDELCKSGIILEDTKEGTRWKRVL